MKSKILTVFREKNPDMGVVYYFPHTHCKEIVPKKYLKNWVMKVGPTSAASSEESGEQGSGD